MNPAWKDFSWPLFEISSAYLGEEFAINESKFELAYNLEWALSFLFWTGEWDLSMAKLTVGKGLPIFANPELLMIYRDFLPNLMNIGALIISLLIKVASI